MEWLDEAACRGASRTLGIRVGVQDIELSGLLHYRSEQGAGRLCAVFATQRWSGVPRNTAPDRYSEVVWADPGGPPADCRALTHAVLNQYVAGTLYGALAMPPAGRPRPKVHQRGRRSAEANCSRRCGGPPDRLRPATRPAVHDRI